MNVELTAPIAELLGKGALAIDQRSARFFQQASALPSLTPAVDATVKRLLELSEHLVPVLSPPRCGRCEGKGHVVYRCTDCDGSGYPIGQTITLTTKCGKCDGGGRFRYIRHVTGRPNRSDFMRCYKCNESGQVPRCEGVLRAGLPVYERTGFPNSPLPCSYTTSDHVCFVGHGHEQRIWLWHAGITTDLTHLRPLDLSGGWVLLLSDVRPL